MGNRVNLQAVTALFLGFAVSSLAQAPQGSQLVLAGGFEQAPMRSADGVVDPTVAMDLEEQVDQVFAEYADPMRAGVAVSVIKDGKVILNKTYGSALVEHQTQIDADNTVFNLGSVSKQFTAFAIMLLVEQGKLSLDDEIHEHIPELNDYGHAINLRHLLHHTSGIRSDLQLLAMAGWSPGDGIDREDVLQAIFRQKELNFAPGDECLYSNSGYDLLAEVVVRVSGISFAEYCRQEIFEPLGMDDSFIASGNAVLIPHLAAPYRLGETGNLRLYPNDRYAGSTGVHATLADLSKWTLNFRDHMGAANARLSKWKQWAN